MDTSSPARPVSSPASPATRSASGRAGATSASSQSEGDPRVYSVEDVAEAAIVSALLARGVRHRDIRRAVDRLAGTWPLQDALLATTEDGHLVLRDNGAVYALVDRGWQRMTTPPPTEDVRLRFRKGRPAPGCHSGSSPSFAARARMKSRSESRLR